MSELFGAKIDKIAVYKAAFAYQGAFRKDFSTGSPVINEVVLEGGFSEGSPSRQASIISGGAGGIFERLEESAGSLSIIAPPGQCFDCLTVAVTHQPASSPENTSEIRSRKII